tara:strand:- start:77 stop:301 length:225 start_codon:yes stop_codon:yes gene_type:complete
MPRHHTVWDAESQRQIEVPFTAEEETVRDTEEAQAEIDMAARDEQDEKFIALEAKLADDSITFEEMKELMRLRG